MFGLIKFFCVSVFVFGIIGFDIYIYLCDINDKVSVYVDNILNTIEKEYDYIVGKNYYYELTIMNVSMYYGETFLILN